MQKNQLKYFLELSELGHSNSLDLISLIKQIVGVINVLDAVLF